MNYFVYYPLEDIFWVQCANAMIKITLHSTDGVQPTMQLNWMPHIEVKIKLVSLIVTTE